MFMKKYICLFNSKRILIIIIAINLSYVSRLGMGFFTEKV